MADWKDSLRNLAASMTAEDGEPEATVSDAAGKENKQKKPVAAGATLHIVTERKGRAGKTATIVCDFPEEMTDGEIASLATRLKQRLGTGGSARGGEILIQGERREEVARLLREEGWKVK